MKDDKTKIIVIVSSCVLALLVIGIVLLIVFGGGAKDDEPDEPAPISDNEPDDPVTMSRGPLICLTGTELADMVISDAAAAEKFVAKAGAELGIQPGTGFTVSLSETVGQHTFYKMNVLYDGVPVFGRSACLCVDARGVPELLSVGADGLPEEAAEPAVGKEDVRAALEALFDSDDLSIVSETEPLVYYCGDDGARLAYDIAVSGVYDENNCDFFEVLLDASDGSVIKKFGRMYHENASEPFDDVVRNADAAAAEAEAEGKTLYYDADRNIRLYDLGGETLVTKLHEDNGGGLAVFYLTGDAGKRRQVNTTLVYSSGKGKADKASALFDGVINAYDFFDKALGKQGIYSWKTPLNIFFNDGMNGATSDAYTAGWGKTVTSQTCISFGTYSRPEPDVIAHEYAHAVENAVSGLIAEGESAAVSEALADIFAELAEDYAEDGVLDGDCDWKHGDRNIADPGSSGCPSSYDGVSGSDQHKNSTVISHAAYLMFRAIGAGKNGEDDHAALASLWYRTLYLIDGQCGFENLASAVVTAAEQMTESGELSEALYEAVRRAFAEVGLSPERSVPFRSGAVLRAVGRDGLPCIDYVVTVTAEDGSEVSRETVKDIRGYKAELTPGVYTVTVTDASGESSRSFEKNILVVDGASGGALTLDALEITTDLATEGTVCGTVVDAKTGLPVKGAELTADRPADENADPESGDTAGGKTADGKRDEKKKTTEDGRISEVIAVTGKDGRFTAQLPFGEQKVEIACEDYETSQVVFDVNAKQTELKEPLKLQRSEGADGQLKYKMKTESFEHRGTDGTVLMSETIVYPYFPGRTAAERNLNKLCGAAAAYYSKLSDDYVARWYSGLSDSSKKEIPLVYNYEAEVTFDEKDVISVIERSTSSTRSGVAQQKESGTVYDILTGRKKELTDFFTGPQDAVNGYIAEEMERQTGLQPEDVYGGLTFALTKDGIKIYVVSFADEETKSFTIPYTRGMEPYVLVTAEETEPELDRQELIRMFVEANDLYCGWLGDALAVITDEGDGVLLNDVEYDRVVSGGYARVTDIENAFDRYFIKDVYDDRIESRYLTFEGKLYALRQEAVAVENDPVPYDLTITAASAEEIRITVTAVGARGEGEDYVLRKDGGEWRFTGDFIGRPGLYDNDGVRWLS